MTEDRKPDGSLPTTGGSEAVSAFVREVGRMPTPRGDKSRGRLLFAMDATASREPTWDQACKIQGEMFGEDYLFIGPSFGNREKDGADWQPPTDGTNLLRHHPARDECGHGRR